MKKILLFVVTLTVITILQAQQKVINLYEGTAPGSESWNWSEAENDNNGWRTKVVYNVAQPTLTVFQPDAATANGTAVIIAPGGAFYALSINSEGFEVANWLIKKGVTCFVLKYRLAHTPGNDPVAEVNGKMSTDKFREETGKVIPLSIADGKAAVAYVRKHAVEFNVSPDRIGIMGFSAGGCVAASAAFNYTPENRPDFVAPVYPFFPKEMQGAIGADAPPLFIVTATNDGLNLAPHSVDLYNSWLNAKKDAELHMYARGNHGFGMRTQNLPTDKWIERFGEWLDVLGLLKKPAFNPAYKAFEIKEYEYAAGQTLKYRILYPENYDKTKKYPLLLFLHGSGERGSDNEKQLTHGAKLFLKEENRKNFPAIILFPQCPENSSWAAYKMDRTVQPAKFELDYTLPVNWPLAAANELVRKMIKEEGADASRVYISGLSMGGFGTFESVYRNPDLYAAALPICGGGVANLYDKKVKKTAFRVFHGDADGSVPVNMSREMVARLKALKMEVQYTEYPGVGHNSWDNVFAEPDYLSWMLTHKRKK